MLRRKNKSWCIFSYINISSCRISIHSGEEWGLIVIITPVTGHSLSGTNLKLYWTQDVCCYQCFLMDNVDTDSSRISRVNLKFHWTWNICYTECDHNGCKLKKLKNQSVYVPILQGVRYQKARHSWCLLDKLLVHYSTERNKDTFFNLEPGFGKYCLKVSCH